MSKIYIRGALGCVIISDILNEKSLESALKWKELIDENCDYVDGSPIPCFLGKIYNQNKINILHIKFNHTKSQFGCHLTHYNIEI